MRKFSPFIRTPKPVIVPVGNESTGIVYLLKKEGLSPCENPVDMQQASRKQAQTTALIYEAVRAYAEKHGVPEAIARDIVLSAKPSLNAVDYLSEPSKAQYHKLIDEVAKTYAEKADIDPGKAKAEVIQAMTPVVGGADVNLFEYLSKESTAAYLELVGDTRDLPYRAATLMLKYRTCYPVELAVTAKAKDDVWKVKPLNCGFQKGDRVRMGNTLVTITAAAEAGDTELAIEPAGIGFPAEMVGFKLDFETGSELHGIPDWSESDTAEMLLESQIQAIYRFYQSEAGQLSDEEVDEAADLGNSQSRLTGSMDLPAHQSSNGNNSTGESNAQELLIPA